MKGLFGGLFLLNFFAFIACLENMGAGGSTWLPFLPVAGMLISARGMKLKEPWNDDPE